MKYERKQCSTCGGMFFAMALDTRSVCAHCARSVPRRPPTGTTHRQHPRDWQSIYQASWRELHTLTDPTLERVKAAIAPALSAGCDCKRHAHEYIEATDPLTDAIMGDLNEYRRWTVRFHNSVSQRLGKRAIEWAEACEVWGW